jgi:Ca-activated chloride channel homolog
VKLYPNKHILVPLKSSEYELEIVNAITSVTLVQTYENPTDKYLELEYSFPINPNACVYRFIADFGKVRVEGIVKEKEEARKEYQ